MPFLTPDSFFTAASLTLYLSWIPFWLEHVIGLVKEIFIGLILTVDVLLLVKDYRGEMYCLAPSIWELGMGDAVTNRDD
jgi:hypothetical protein